jgi:hypothetical protein
LESTKYKLPSTNQSDWEISRGRFVGGCFLAKHPQMIDGLLRYLDNSTVCLLDFSFKDFLKQVSGD